MNKNKKIHTLYLIGSRPGGILCGILLVFIYFYFSTHFIENDNFSGSESAMLKLGSYLLVITGTGMIIFFFISILRTLIIVSSVRSKGTVTKGHITTSSDIVTKRHNNDSDFVSYIHNYYIFFTYMGENDKVCYMRQEVRKKDFMILKYKTEIMIKYYKGYAVIVSS